LKQLAAMTADQLWNHLGGDQHLVAVIYDTDFFLYLQKSPVGVAEKFCLWN